MLLVCVCCRVSSPSCMCTWYSKSNHESKKVYWYIDSISNFHTPFWKEKHGNTMKDNVHMTSSTWHPPTSQNYQFKSVQVCKFLHGVRLHHGSSWWFWILKILCSQSLSRFRLSFDPYPWNPMKGLWHEIDLYFKGGEKNQRSLRAGATLCHFMSVQQTLSSLSTRRSSCLLLEYNDCPLSQRHQPPTMSIGRFLT